MSFGTTAFGFSFFGDPGNILLKWSAVPGAVSYNVYHNTTPGLSTAFTPILTNTVNLTYVHNNLMLGSTHYYIVAAVGINGELGAASNELNVIIPL